MPLRNILKRKDKDESDLLEPVTPEFTFLRTTTETQEIITPPRYPGDAPEKVSPPKHRIFHRQHNENENTLHRSLSDRLHLNRSRSASTSSVNLPSNLPAEPSSLAKDAEDEAAWEKRATILAKENKVSRPNSPARIHGISDAPSDENIQEAIRLHEAGDLSRSTEMFGRLASPNGPNNALSQVLYGLALRHGWGVAKNEARAVQYLSLAASNSADVEAQALAAGVKKGGAAKGELTLAMFELANCFRNGWGVQKDPVAARHFYESAANMGDFDAMNEAAWCYVEGFGCKKDKFKAAQYLRRAEEQGNKQVGNAWIWKDKYGGPKKT